MSEPHEIRSKFYFPDGNLVISCRSNEGTPTYFRIHQSVLATHSPVIKDMLDLPAPSGQIEVYDGAPLVEFSDDPQDMEIFLHFFYLPFTPPLDDKDLDIAFKLFGVLKLADRLMVDDLKTNILKKIKASVPATLEQWDEMQRDNGSLTDAWPEPASVIRLARHFDPSLLSPLLFYDLSVRDPFVTYGKKADLERNLLAGRAARWDLVGSEDRLAAEVGRRRLIEYWRWGLEDDIRPKCSNGDANCTVMLKAAFSHAHQWRQLDPLSLLKTVASEYVYDFPSICPNCAISLAEELEELRRRLYEILPTCYKYVT